jgi:hypothetical protein
MINGTIAINGRAHILSSTGKEIFLKVALKEKIEKIIKINSKFTIKLKAGKKEAGKIFERTTSKNKRINGPRIK